MAIRVATCFERGFLALFIYVCLIDESYLIVRGNQRFIIHSFKKKISCEKWKIDRKLQNDTMIVLIQYIEGLQRDG